ncbi:MAG: thioredoxin [Butyrivibrio sp.]|nr:thioredoxin [Butyrivibrio sp.]
MAVKVLNAANFDDEIANGVTVVDFSATWCGPCKMMAPVFDSASEKHKDIKFGKIDIDSDMDIAMKYKVMSVPTLVLFRDGEVADKSIGLISAAQLEEFLAK